MGKLLYVADVARILDLPCSRIRRLIRAGILPCVRLGRRTIRIPETALDAWLQDLARGRDYVAEGMAAPATRTDGGPRR